MLWVASANSVQLNIFSNTLVSINGYNKTSKYLLGSTAYSVTPLHNDSYLTELNKNLGVNVIGFGEDLGGILPFNQTESIKCCNTTEGLKQYIESGQACAKYKNSYDPKIWNSNYFKQNTSITTFIYLKDNCQSNYYPQDYHCLGNDTGTNHVYMYTLVCL